MRRTKLIATLGPATDAPGVLEALVAAGLDVARLNASHGTRADLERRLVALRAIAEGAGRHVAAMLDLAGAKVRVGEMTPGVALEPGAEFWLLRGTAPAGPGTAEGVPVTYAGQIHNTVAAGVDVVVIGKYASAGGITADELQTKCPSKYQGKATTPPQATQ